MRLVRASSSMSLASAATALLIINIATVMVVPPCQADFAGAWIRHGRIDPRIGSINRATTAAPSTQQTAPPGQGKCVPCDACSGGCLRCCCNAESDPTKQICVATLPGAMQNRTTTGGGPGTDCKECTYGCGMCCCGGGRNEKTAEQMLARSGGVGLDRNSDPAAIRAQAALEQGAQVQAQMKAAAAGKNNDAATAAGAAGGGAGGGGGGGGAATNPATSAAKPGNTMAPPRQGQGVLNKGSRRRQ